MTATIRLEPSGAAGTGGRTRGLPWRRRAREPRLPLSAFKQRETQKRFVLILAAKLIGLALLALGMKFAWTMLGSPAGAQEATEGPVADNLISPINTMWVLVAAFLVFFMQAGFMALEAGFARSRESVNIMMECIFDTCLCGLLYFAIGFAFAFGTGNGIIGHEFFFLHGATPAYGSTGVDRKSTRLNSSHLGISYAVFCF